MFFSMSLAVNDCGLSSLLSAKTTSWAQAQRARGKLMQEVRDNFKDHAFVGNATDWERVCVGNLVGMPIIVVPTGFKQISNAPSNNSRRRSTVTTGVYAPPEHDHIVRFLLSRFNSFFLLVSLCGFYCITNFNYPEYHLQISYFCLKDLGIATAII